ncbi:YaiI/YqxD family protein [Sporohalobacter salinus]|uniref:YaiI/YqxD family protein n=1 Tax=Sporohalobacter salinus TaxID=1494606 RepID=UPI001EF78FCF|nr:YaiI/YqxD family protein [Sporohalobacter salinus]MBM7623195.1 uncharacterized protein YaiI (UPF0178 family) [Sporohalobacter salinus]
MQILVDGDACPIKELIVDLAVKYSCEVIIISSIAHWSNRLNNKLVKEVTVDSDPEAVDMKIVNLASSGDLVITQDYGLAALLLEQEIKVLSPRGKVFTRQNIDYLLAKRHQASKLRRSGRKTKGPSEYSKKDQRRFKTAFIKLVNS